MDIVTQIQEQVDKLSVALYSTLGALQRDAQPVSVRGEPAPASTSKVSNVTYRGLNSIQNSNSFSDIQISLI